MSLIQMRIFSEALNKSVGVNVILPMPRRADAPCEGLPVLTLLHGMGDDSTMWLRRTNVERYALERGIAVVMPDGGLSCYHNMLHGGRYRDYILDELPGLLRAMLPLSARREDNFIAGCSMGGFGALKLGMARAEQYAAIGCFSAAHMEYRPEHPRNQAMLARVYGETLDDCDAQIEADILAVNAGSRSIRLWHACGDNDVLRENALKSRDFFEALPEGAVDYSFETLPGKHDWALWDRMLAEFMRLLPAAEGRFM